MIFFVDEGFQPRLRERPAEEKPYPPIHAIELECTIVNSNSIIGAF